MELPLQVCFRQMEPSDEIEDMVRGKLEKLDRYYDHIMACRVVIDAPTKPTRHYQVRIDLTVPGGELVVGQREGDVHRDLAAALRDAVDAARRQLEDFARRQRGDVKVHA